MDKLPKVYINKIDTQIKNNQEETIVSNNKTINYDDILSKDKYVFNHTYIITLNNNETIEDSIIDKIDNKILTMNNKWIDTNNIKTIIEIKK